MLYFSRCLCLKLNTAFALCYLFISNSVFSQKIITDRYSNDVFQYYEVKSFQINTSFSDAGPNAGFSYTFPSNSKFYYVNDTTNKTVAESQGLSLSFKVAKPTNDKQFYLNDVNSTRLSTEFQIGYQETVDKIYDFDLLNSTTDHFTYAWGINFLLKTDNIKLYDTSLKTERISNPVSYGLSAHGSVFWKRWFIPSASVLYESTWDKLKSPFYQYNTPSYSDDNVIVLESNVGRIAPIQRINNFRIRVSSIIIPFPDRLGITPYYVYESGYSRSLYGFTINIFENRVIKKSESGVSLGKTFGIGMDWERINDKPTSVRYFVFGSLDISKFVKKRKPVGI